MQIALRYGFSFLVFCIFHSLHAQTPYQLHKNKVCTEIYQRIEAAARDHRPAPAFVFIYQEDETPYYNAYFNPKNNTINFGEGLYDLAASFGADSTHVLAYVLGHELAHFYKDHNWGMAFGTANRDTKIADEIYEETLSEAHRIQLEAEADYFGGLFGYLAGYNTLELGDDFIHALYEKLDMPDDTEGYPNRNDRAKISQNSADKLRGLVPAFNTAHNMLLIGDYHKAARNYEYIMQAFPSREMHNNLGVTYALEALQYFTPETLIYAYPFGVDTDTRLQQSTRRAATDESPTAARQRLLKAAQQAFEQAISMDEHYTPAYVNLALTYLLLDDLELGKAFAKKAAKFAQAQTQPLLLANAQIAEGIAWARLSDKSNAKKAFQAAQPTNTEYAKANLEALQTGRIAQLFKKKKQGEIKANLPEQIAEASPDMADILLEMVDSRPLLIPYQNEDRPGLLLTTGTSDGLYFEIIATFDERDDLIASRVLLHTTTDYTGTTARNIEQGDSRDAVIKAYGQPSHRMSSAQETFLVYDSTPIIFRIDTNNRVTGWILYSR